MLNEGHPMKQIAATLGCSQQATLARIRRNTVYFISRLPRPKYEMLRQMLLKKRLLSDIAETLDLHITLINCAHEAFLSDCFPPYKDLGKLR